MSGLDIGIRIRYGQVDEHQHQTHGSHHDPEIFAEFHVHRIGRAGQNRRSVYLAGIDPSLSHPISQERKGRSRQIVFEMLHFFKYTNTVHLLFLDSSYKNFGNSNL